MNVIYGNVSLIFGFSSFAFTHAAGLPVFGLAIGAAGLLRRESRGEKRTTVYAICGIGCLICIGVTLLVLLGKK